MYDEYIDMYLIMCMFACVFLWVWTQSVALMRLEQGIISPQTGIIRGRGSPTWVQKSNSGLLQEKCVSLGAEPSPQPLGYGFQYMSPLSFHVLSFFRAANRANFLFLFSPLYGTVLSGLSFLPKYQLAAYVQEQVSAQCIYTQAHQYLASSWCEHRPGLDFTVDGNNCQWECQRD